MHRFYAAEPIRADRPVALTEEDTRHAMQVLRLKAGDQAELFSGGERWLCTAEHVSSGEVLFRPDALLPSTEPAHAFTLYQGLPKADKMEWIVQKAVELGASRIVPVMMARSVVRLDERDAGKKRTRWQRIAHEACKQSGRCVEPVVADPLTVTALARELRQLDAAAVPWEESHGATLRDFAAANPGAERIGIVIGPEGGIEPQEIDTLREAGCCPVTLGPRILRTETAGLASLSVLLSLYGDI